MDTYQCTLFKTSMRFWRSSSRGVACSLATPSCLAIRAYGSVVEDLAFRIVSLLDSDNFGQYQGTSGHSDISDLLTSIGSCSAWNVHFERFTCLGALDTSRQRTTWTHGTEGFGKGPWDLKLEGAYNLHQLTFYHLHNFTSCCKLPIRLWTVYTPEEMGHKSWRKRSELPIFPDAHLLNGGSSNIFKRRIRIIRNHMKPKFLNSRSSFIWIPQNIQILDDPWTGQWGPRRGWIRYDSIMSVPTDFCSLNISDQDEANEEALGDESPKEWKLTSFLPSSKIVASVP